MFALAAAGGALAQEGTSPRATLRLPEALERALGHNKDLAAFLYRIAEQQGRREQAGLLPNPWLDVSVEDAAGTGIYEGFDSAQTTLSLGWVLEGWVRKGRVGVAEAGVDLVAADARILRIEVAADTAEHFLASLASQARPGEEASRVVRPSPNQVLVRGGQGSGAGVGDEPGELVDVAAYHPTTQGKCLYDARAAAHKGV